VLRPQLKLFQGFKHAAPKFSITILRVREGHYRIGQSHVKSRKVTRSFPFAGQVSQSGTIALPVRSRVRFTAGMIAKGTMVMLVRSSAIGMYIRFGPLVRFPHNLGSYRPPLERHLAFQLDTAHLASL
jgi:hypothetical protein